MLWLLATVVLSVSRDAAFANAELRAASTMHNEMLEAVMRAPMAFFDTTPLGRIINRFSADLQVVDIQMRISTQQLWLVVAGLTGTLALLLVNSPYILAGIVPLKGKPGSSVVVINSPSPVKRT